MVCVSAKPQSPPPSHPSCKGLNKEEYITILSFSSCAISTHMVCYCRGEEIVNQIPDPDYVNAC